MFQHDRFLTQEVPFQLRLLQMPKRPSKKWMDTLKNGTMEHSRGRSTETSNGLAAIQEQLNNLGREIKKVNEKVYAAQVGCEQCKGPHYTKYCPLKEEAFPLNREVVPLLSENHHRERTGTPNVVVFWQ
ncbi:putative reverse transcriptase domain-containing protein [Tanacetum coccineum]